MPSKNGGTIDKRVVRVAWPKLMSPETHGKTVFLSSEQQRCPMSERCAWFVVHLHTTYFRQQLTGIPPPCPSTPSFAPLRTLDAEPSVRVDREQDRERAATGASPDGERPPVCAACCAFASLMFVSF